jgi:hypothetical protein
MELHELALDDIDKWSSHGSRDQGEKEQVRALLLGMRSRGLLDGQALLAEMKKRGHGRHALKMLKEQIDKTYREPGLDDEHPR